MSRRTRRLLPLLAALLVTAWTVTPAQAQPGHGFAAHGDAYRVRSAHVLDGNVLRNDPGATALVRHTQPTHGALRIGADGRFQYAPETGFHGTDTFTYTVSDAVRLYTTHLPPLTTIGGVPFTSGAFGSSLAPVPGPVLRSHRPRA